MTPTLSTWPDDLAVYRYLADGRSDGSLDASPRPYAGSLEDLRDQLRGRPEPLGAGPAAPATADAASPTSPSRPRRRPWHLDHSTHTSGLGGLLDPAFAARFTGERDASPATPPPATPPSATPPGDLPDDAWFLEHADTIWAILKSGSFGSRAPVAQVPVCRAFDAYRHGRGGDRWAFWRLLNFELWWRENVDTDPADPARPPVPLLETPGPEYETQADGRHRQAPPKSDYEPNAHKRLLLTNGRWARFPLRVDLVARGDDVPALVARRATEFFAGLPAAPAETAALASGRPWFVFVGEKIVAIAQGRYVLVEDIRPGRPALLLVKAIGATPFGIGVSQPETMQVAIDEVGLPRIALAAAAGAAGKVLRRRGWFYRVAGSGVASIDGPADYCAYPANVSAKLAPKDPSGVARAVSTAVRAQLPPEVVAGFGGTVLIDSNDLGRDVLGHDTGRDPGWLAAAYADNPTGQGREQTPISLVFAQA